MNDPTYRQLLGIAGLVAIGVVASFALSLDSLLSGLEALAARPLVFAGLLLGVYLIRPFLLWPVSSIAIVLGYLYDPMVAIPVAILGAAISGLPPYFIGSYFQTDAGVFGWVGASGEQIVAVVGETRGVIAARFSPVPGDPISYSCGLSGVSLRSFFVGTAIGEIPWAIVAVFAGASMRTVSMTGEVASIEFALSLLGLAALILAGPVYSHRKQLTRADQL